MEQPVSSRITSCKTETQATFRSHEYDFSQGKRGAVLPSSGKTRVTIMLDDDVIEAFRARAEVPARATKP